MDARLLACLALAVLPPAAYALDVSLPCSVRADGRMIAAEYEGMPRRNPDGSFYPGDAFYYIFRFSASSTCLGLSAGPVVSHDGLELVSHESVTWQDAGRRGPGEAEAREVDVGEPRAHPHSDAARAPRLLETVHYYWREGGPHMFSVREDSGLQGWQKRALSGKDYWTQSTREWDYAERGQSHAHLPPCGMLDEGAAHRGGDGLCVEDALEDGASFEKFMEAVAESCSMLRLYSGCVFGKAVIGAAPGERRCLIGELEEMGVKDLPARDRCIAADPRVELAVTGLKKKCGTSEHNVFSCRAVPVRRAAALAPDVLEPDLGLLLRHERVSDSDGYLARNADGTYYATDPVAILHEPVLKWKDERHPTVRFEVSAGSRLPLESRLWCTDGPCEVRLERGDTMPSGWRLGHGEGLSVYSAPDEGHLGSVDFEYRVDAYNGDVPLGSAPASESALIVAYDPVHSAHAYPVLSDDGRTSYEDRVGLALHYFGSRDGGLVHEGRRSKVDRFSYYGEARGPWEHVPLSARLEWSGARGAGHEAEHAQEAARLYPGAAPWRDGDACDVGRHGTLMAVRAGYCLAYFSYPVLGEVEGPSGPRLEGVVLRGSLASGLAGKHTELLRYEYRFAEPLFHSELRVRAAGPDGSEMPVPLRVDVEPAGPPLAGYVREKTLHDTGDPGFAGIAAGDAYPASYSESGTGQLSAKLRRVSSDFPSYGGSADASGLGVEELARSYLASSSSARLAVPFEAGLGAPSPVSVTVTAGGAARQYEYLPDFARDVEIVVNVAQDNPLHAQRRDGYVEASVMPWFGEAVAWHAGGKLLDIECPSSCALPAWGSGPVRVEAENAWGGRAAADVPGLPPEPPRPPASANLAALAIFAVSLPAVWWAHRRIRG